MKSHWWWQKSTWVPCEMVWPRLQRVHFGRREWWPRHARCHSDVLWKAFDCKEKGAFWANAVLCCDCRNWKLSSEPSELLASYKIMGCVQKVLDRLRVVNPSCAYSLILTLGTFGCVESCWSIPPRKFAK
jgi:hypothetical protein